MSRDIVSSECHYESGKYAKYKAQTLWRIYSEYCGDVTPLTGSDLQLKVLKIFNLA